MPRGACRQAVVELDVGVTLGAGDGAGLEARVEDLPLAINDEEPRAARDRREAPGELVRFAHRIVVAAVQVLGKLLRDDRERRRVAADEVCPDDRVLGDLRADAQAPDFADLRLADEIDHGRGGAAAVDGRLGDRHEGQGRGEAATSDVGDEELGLVIGHRRRAARQAATRGPAPPSSRGRRTSRQSNPTIRSP